MLTRPQPTGTTHHTLELQLEAYRRELTGYCYRMLGSPSEAEDAVQETMVRAWRKADSLQAREALRSWLYRIATNVCFDMLDGAKRRARPMDLTEAVTADSPLAPPLTESVWVQPIHDGQVMPDDADPAEQAVWRETLKLAFVAALQHLPARQRAVLILREVLRWQASEVAELLDTSVASVNSALQRARATLESLDLDSSGPTALDGEKQELLEKYMEAFERYDVEALVKLLHDDAIFNMPPHPMWLVGPEDVAKWMVGPGIGCKSARLIATSANGCPAFAIYRTAEPGVHRPFNLCVLDVADGKVTGVHNFLFPELFPRFGLPTELRES